MHQSLATDPHPPGQGNSGDIDFHPHAFLKKRLGGYCNLLPLSVMLSPPKPLDEIEPNLMCELVRPFFFARPWGPREGPKGQISLIFNF